MFNATVEFSIIKDRKRSKAYTVTINKKNVYWRLHRSLENNFKQTLKLIQNKKREGKVECVSVIKVDTKHPNKRWDKMHQKKIQSEHEGGWDVSFTNGGEADYHLMCKSVLSSLEAWVEKSKFVHRDKMIDLLDFFEMEGQEELSKWSPKFVEEEQKET